MLSETRGKNLCYTAEEWLADVPSVKWIAELENGKIVHRIGEISKQNIEDAAWFLLATYSKTSE